MKLSISGKVYNFKLWLWSSNTQEKLSECGAWRRSNHFFIRCQSVAQTILVFFSDQAFYADELECFSGPCIHVLIFLSSSLTEKAFLTWKYSKTLTLNCCFLLNVLLFIWPTCFVQKNLKLTRKSSRSKKFILNKSLTWKKYKIKRLRIFLQGLTHCIKNE